MADTCIGRSEFIQKIDTESALDGEKSGGDYTVEKRAVRQQRVEATWAGNPKPVRSTTSVLVAYHQNKELIGDNGLLPLKNYMRRINDNIKPGDNLLNLSENSAIAK